MLSGIQHFCFCKRQWALIHLEQMWTDDARTASGDVFHEKVDQQTKETRGGMIMARAVAVSSPSLGLSGRCDVVEFIESPNGHEVEGMTGLYLTRPIEYKIGRRKKDDWDRIQLCAEAIALEESLNTRVDTGFLFYGMERRREEVTITESLRMTTKSIADEMHRMYKAGLLPPAEQKPACKKCSLQNDCMPEASHNKSVSDYISHLVQQ